MVTIKMFQFMMEEYSKCKNIFDEAFVMLGLVVFLTFGLCLDIFMIPFYILAFIFRILYLIFS